MAEEMIMCPPDGHWIGCNYPFFYKGYYINKEWMIKSPNIYVEKNGKVLKYFKTVEEAETYIDIQTFHPRMIVGNTESKNVNPIIQAINNLLGRKVMYKTTYHAMDGKVDVEGDVSDEEYEKICQSKVLVDLLYESK